MPLAQTCRHGKIRYTRRDDKYGQNHRASCSCGAVSSNWHTDKWKAEHAFYANYSLKHKEGKLLCR